MIVAVLIAVLALEADDPPPAETQPAAKDAAVSAVTVNGAQKPQVTTSIDRRSYAVANDVQAQTGSIADILRNIPSVQVDLDGNLSLRGDSVTVLIDGKPEPQFNGESRGSALQSMPANRIDRVEVITNPSAEFRADGVGIINLVTKRAKGAGRTGSARLQASSGDQGQVSANIGYNADRLSTTADFSYRKDHRLPITRHEQLLPGSTANGPDHSLDLSQGERRRDALQGHAGGDYDLDAKTRLSGSLRFYYEHNTVVSADQFTQIGGTGNLVAAFGRVSDQHTMQDVGDASLILRHKWDDGHDLTLTGLYHDNRYAVDRTDDVRHTQPADQGQSTEAFRLNFNRTSTFNADYQRPLSGMATLKLGYDVQFANNFVKHRGGLGVPGGAIAPDPDKTGSLAEDETDNQAYLTYERPFGALDALFGLRGEQVRLALDEPSQPAPLPPRTYSRLYPTLHLAYDLTEGRRLTASYSKRVVRPSVLQLDPFIYTDIPGLLQQGNPRLTPQDTDSYEVGYEAQKDAASFSATLYYRQSNNAFSLVATTQSDGDLLQRTENAGGVRNGGVEFVVTRKLTQNLSYNIFADAYWTQLSASNLGFAQSRSAFTGFGSANLNWQVTPKDFVQFNLFVNGETLFPQGYQPAFASTNIGYRHTINDKVSWTLVVQDPFKTMKTRLVLDGVGGKDRQWFASNSRTVSLTLVWNFSGKPQPVGFDFGGG